MFDGWTSEELENELAAVRAELHEVMNEICVMIDGGPANRSPAEAVARMEELNTSYRAILQALYGGE